MINNRRAKVVTGLITTVLALAGRVLPASAQTASTIEVSETQYGYGCQLGNDQGPGVRTVYVRHTFSVGSLASRFRILLGPGATMTYLSETHPYPMTVGNTQDGISICYGSCTPPEPLLLATISYMSYATDANCSKVLIMPHPSAQTVEVVGCDGVPEAAFVREMNILAPHGVCGCPDPHKFAGAPQVFDCNSLPVASTTWGAIKSLYSN